MKPAKTFLFLFLFCSTHLAAQQTINGTLMHDNIEREYILYIPEIYDPETPTPLVFSFHGYSSNATLQMNYANFTSIADTAGFILVHPQGTLLNGITHWNVGGWTIGSTVDDVGFTEALIDSLSNAYNINPDRIYSTGMSNGGYMSFLLACQLSDRIAAIASVTGSMTIQTYADCDPQHPTPVLQIHGTSDSVVPYNGDPFWTESIEDVLDYWVQYNNCNPSPAVTSIPDLDSSDGSTVEHLIYSEGENEVTTEHFKVYGGDHDWPGSWGNMDIDASIEVWRFFARYDINGLIETATVSTTAPIIEPEIQVLPNPVISSLTIRNKKEIGTPYQLYTASGKMVLSGILASEEHTMDLSALPAGIFLLRIQEEVVRVVKSR
ncbi:MAG: T9SS type A sorting domain-containing protein [Bacteroidetes bacterium]|nr:T9SS type A sorting domain-containing protein [Bacteroidota bacterium]